MRAARREGAAQRGLPLIGLGAAGDVPDLGSRDRGDLARSRWAVEPEHPDRADQRDAGGRHLPASPDFSEYLDAAPMWALLREINRRYPSYRLI